MTLSRKLADSTGAEAYAREAEKARHTEALRKLITGIKYFNRQEQTISTSRNVLVLLGEPIY